MQTYNSIVDKLNDSFSPEYLSVVNESHGHNVPEGSETHFKVTVVSQVFNGLNRVKRQQSVYQVLAELMSGPVHALSMNTYTPDEWLKQPKPSVSPPCMGGSH